MRQDGPPVWMYVALAAGVVLLFSLTFGLGRCSAPDDVDPVLLPADVDAGPGEAMILAELDAAVRAEDERLEEIRVEQEAEVEAFTEADRAEYEETRRRGRGALASWFKERTTRLLADAGPP